MDQIVELDLAQTNRNLSSMGAEERIQWAVATFGEDAVMLSSMQKSASVLMHMFHRLGLSNEILFVDTGYHFAETLQVRDEFMRRYGLAVMTLYPELTPEQQEVQFGRKLYRDREGQVECCRMRKSAPYINHVVQQGRRVVMVGLRDSEGGQRAGVDLLAEDPRIRGYTLHPILDWSDEQIDAYLARYGIPVHALHARSYPSIGCQCCTTPVKPGENPRAGRWRHLRESEGEGPEYCNILFTDGGGI